MTTNPTVVQCEHCRGVTFCSVDERKPDGSYGPGPLERCVSCKATRAIANPESLLAVTQEDDPRCDCCARPKSEHNNKMQCEEPTYFRLATRPAPPEVLRLRAENERLSHAVAGGILGELLNDDEEQALVDFIKHLRSTAAEPLLARQDVRPAEPVAGDMVDRANRWLDAHGFHLSCNNVFGPTNYDALRQFIEYLSTLPTAGVREERRIIAWLRDQSADKQDREWMGPLDIADAIERGEHRATEEPKL